MKQIVSFTFLIFIVLSSHLATAQPFQPRVVWHDDAAREAIISWTTYKPGKTHNVTFGTQRDLSPASIVGTLNASFSGKLSSTERVDAFVHHATLTQLAPSTDYYFYVSSDGESSKTYYFRTAPEDDRPFKFVYGGDSRSDSQTRRKMNQRIATMLDRDPSIIAFVHGGDYNVFPSLWREWGQWLEDHMLSYGKDGRILPIIPARGNHEGNGEMYDEVFGFPGGKTRDYWVTAIGTDFTLITLDSNSSMGGEQSGFLSEVLKHAIKGRWITANYHRPAYPAVKSPGAAHTHFVPLFESYNVDFVLESDGHALKRTVPIRGDKFDPSGVVYLGEGGLGVPQRTPDATRWFLQPPGYTASAHHVQLFDVHPDRVKYSAIGIDGNTLDSYTFKPKRTGRVRGPRGISASFVSKTKLHVKMSEELDLKSLDDLSGFKFEPAIEIKSVTWNADNRLVVIEVNPPEAGTYVLSISGLKDLAGQPNVGSEFSLVYDKTAAFPTIPSANTEPELEPEPPKVVEVETANVVEPQLDVQYDEREDRGSGKPWVWFLLLGGFVLGGGFVVKSRSEKSKEDAE